MNKFEKVSFNEFKSACNDKLHMNADDSTLQIIYKNIKLPQRSTSGSGGYDFYMPFSTQLSPSTIVANFTSKSAFDTSYNYITVPTGIRWVTDEPNLILLLLPRSGLGVKNGFRIKNTIGCIDSDYAMSDNEGHIFCTFSVENDTEFSIGKAFMQGLIVPFCTVDDDNVSAVRNGGFGSTDNN